MSIFLDIDELTVRQLAIDINTQGYAKLEGAIKPEMLEQLRDYIENITTERGAQYFALHGENALAGSTLASLARSAEFRELLGSLHYYGTGRYARNHQVFPVLRCVQGSTGLKESNAFHYDATVVTALVPIHIPQEGDNRGDLILFPNLRKVRAFVLSNVIEKAVLQNKLSRKFITWAIKKQWLKPTTLRIVPGSIYFFWGYRSLHANQPCDPAFRRATALFHFGDPHAGSSTTRLILKLNQRRARLATTQTGNTTI